MAAQQQASTGAIKHRDRCAEVEMMQRVTCLEECGMGAEMVWDEGTYDALHTIIGLAGEGVKVGAAYPITPCATRLPLLPVG